VERAVAILDGAALIHVVGQRRSFPVASYLAILQPSRLSRSPARRRRPACSWADAGDRAGDAVVAIQLSRLHAQCSTRSARDGVGRRRHRHPTDPEPLLPLATVVFEVEEVATRFLPLAHRLDVLALSLVIGLGYRRDEGPRSTTPHTALDAHLRIANRQHFRSTREADIALGAASSINGSVENAGCLPRLFRDPRRPTSASRLGALACTQRPSMKDIDRRTTSGLPAGLVVDVAHADKARRRSSGRYRSVFRRPDGAIQQGADGFRQAIERIGRRVPTSHARLAPARLTCPSWWQRARHWIAASDRKASTGAASLSAVPPARRVAAPPRPIEPASNKASRVGSGGTASRCDSGASCHGSSSRPAHRR